MVSVESIGGRYKGKGTDGTKYTIEVGRFDFGIPVSRAGGWRSRKLRRTDDGREAITMGRDGREWYACRP